MNSDLAQKLWLSYPDRHVITDRVAYYFMFRLYISITLSHFYGC